MDIFYLVIMILGGMTLSLIAIYLWVGFWDSVVSCLKKLFHIGKKEKVTWHTLDNENYSVSENQIKQTEDKISENERLY